MYEHLMVVVIFSKCLIQPTEQITLNIVLYIRCTINYVILFITMLFFLLQTDLQTRLAMLNIILASNR